MNKEKLKLLESLPEDVMVRVKNTLRAFPEVRVIFENGEYHVSAHICLRGQYAPDRKYIGEFKSEEIFTIEQRVLNYCEAFHEYPAGMGYRGKTNFGWLNNLPWEAKLKYDEDGNIVEDIK